MVTTYNFFIVHYKSSVRGHSMGAAVATPLLLFLHLGFDSTCIYFYLALTLVWGVLGSILGAEAHCYNVR